MRIATVCLLALLLACCKPDPPKSWTAHDLDAPSRTETIHLNDADGDLADALKRGDHRFMGIMGQALGLPGVNREEQLAVRKAFGVKVVDGISDVENDTSRRIGEPARIYAEKYNTALLEKLRSTAASPPPESAPRP